MIFPGIKEINENSKNLVKATVHQSTNYNNKVMILYNQTRVA